MKAQKQHDSDPVRVPFPFDEAIERALKVKPPAKWNGKPAKRRKRSSKSKAKGKR